MKPNNTVIWSKSARQELARIWLRAADQKSLTQTIDDFDALLRMAPENAATERQDELRAATLPGLRIVFTISEDDRIVNVLVIRETH